MIKSYLSCGCRTAHKIAVPMMHTASPVPIPFMFQLMPMVASDNTHTISVMMAMINSTISPPEMLHHKLPRLGVGP